MDIYLITCISVVRKSLNTVKSRSAQCSIDHYMGNPFKPYICNSVAAGFAEINKYYIMKTPFIKRLRKFLRTTLIGGFVALAPLTLIILLFRWVINLIGRILTPVVDKILQSPDPDPFFKFSLYVITFVVILIFFFLIGIVVRTRLSVFLNRAEDRYLVRIPGYKLAKETVQQFFGKNRSFFREVVLVDIYNSGTLMTGFITDDQGDIITVFVPTGPNPTSGNIFHLTKDRVLRTGASVDSGMKSIISCGAGSAEVFASMKKH